LGPHERIDITITARILEGEFPSISNRACVRSSGNTTVQCAAFDYLNPLLPPTGETPQPYTFLHELLILILGISTFLAGVFGLRFVLSKTKQSS
jgi:hypothetical protein